MKIAIGIILMILAVAIAVVPYFNTCHYHDRDMKLESGMTTPMRCYYSAQAEIGVGIPLFAIGALILASRRKESLIMLSIAGVVLGAVTMAIPTALIGVCSSPMTCNTFMQSFLLATGSLVTVACLTGLVIGLTSKEKES